ncbi:hypothetical protein Tco_0011197 [Tanacetum coccineum]
MELEGMTEATKLRKSILQTLHEMAHTSSGSSSSSDFELLPTAAASRVIRQLLNHLRFKSENIDVITVVTPSNVKNVESNHESADVKNNVKHEVEFIPNVENKSVRPSTEKIKFAKSARETPKQNKHYPIVKTEET